MSVLRQLKRLANIGSQLVMALTVIVGLALPARGDDGRPFRGHAEEVIIDVTPVADGFLVTASGGGEATHLGRFTRLGRVVVHGDGSAEGTVVFTAANGDQLFMEVVGVPTNSPTTIGGTYTFTGGTGRFSDASGTANFAGVHPMGPISPSRSRARYGTDRRTRRRTLGGSRGWWPMFFAASPYRCAADSVTRKMKRAQASCACGSSGGAGLGA